MKVVIGLGFGDEGKGVTVDYLCSQIRNPLVVRFCGGQQAGHNVINGNQSHIFMNFGSGLFQGAETYWSKYCTCDPVGIRNEFKILKDKGLNPILCIDRECQVTTIYDKASNIYDKKSSDHGTVGVGFGSTLQRQEDHFSLVFTDIFYPKVLERKLEMMRKWYYSDIDLPDDHLDNFHDACSFIRSSPNIHIAKKSMLNRGTFGYGDLIFEGAQGLMLDKDIGFFPHVTRSNTGMQNVKRILSDFGIHDQHEPIEKYLVTRAYQTRHGNGPMTNEDIPHSIQRNLLETNLDTGVQGRFRISLLDLDLISYALDRYPELRIHNTLVVTCLEHMKDYRFTFKGKIHECKSEIEFLERIGYFLTVGRLMYCRNHQFTRIEL